MGKRNGAYSCERTNKCSATSFTVHIALGMKKWRGRLTCQISLVERNNFHSHWFRLLGKHFFNISFQVTFLASREWRKLVEALLGKSVRAYKLRYMAYYEKIFISRGSARRRMSKENLIKCKLLLLIDVPVWMPSAVTCAFECGDYGVWQVVFSSMREAFLAEGSVAQIHKQPALCVNHVIYDSPQHYFHVKIPLPQSFWKSRYVYFPFPTQPPNENNNFDHNKAAKIISRGSWLNIVDR